jgi:hypothetical protein
MYGRAEGGSVVNARTFIGSFLVLSAMVWVVATINLSRRPVLSVPLAQAPQAAAAPAGKLEPERAPPAPECSSTAFVDYAAGARGLATPLLAVLSYRPDAGDLKMQSLQGGLAVVEELVGGTKVAVYEVFRMKGRGWLVGQADTFSPCNAAR